MPEPVVQPLLPEVVEQLVAGDSQDPGKRRDHGPATPQLRDGGEERLLGQILGEGDLCPTAVQEVAIDTRQRRCIEDLELLRVR